jgi:hypothetical protein
LASQDQHLHGSLICLTNWINFEELKLDNFEKEMMKYGKSVGEFPLQYAGQSSQFNVSLPVMSKGVYDITVYAYDPSNGNTGLDKATFVVE